MPEELSPESKLYVKEEIEKVRKEFKEELKEAQSKATKILSTVALIVGLLTGVGVYSFAKDYMTTTIQTNVKTAIDEKLGEQAVKEFKKRITEAEGYVEDACDLHAKIFEYEKDANDSYKNIVEIETKMEQIIPVGTIVPYGGEIVETKHGEAFEVREGWLLCNGARLDCKKYEDLFGVIGWAFGAPDSNDPNTFSLPDLRGRVTVGAGSGKRLTKRTLGEKGGEEKHTLTINEMPKHTHDWLKGTARDDSGFGGSEPEYVDKKGTISGLIGFTGGGNSHNNMQPFLVVNYIIKY